ncbi:MAG TPA: hypothetical protein VEY11_08260 [Pyrinomonadaceae bacterium]|nr:hypothetical protein [Pyrinomonadaceae bacterium]
MVSTQTSGGADESRRQNFDATEESPETAGGGDGSLEETAAREREYLRGRVSEELGHEPTEEELDEWLREHTEGH